MNGGWDKRVHNKWDSRPMTTGAQQLHSSIAHSRLSPAVQTVLEDWLYTLEYTIDSSLSTMNCTDNTMISCQKITHSHTGCTQKEGLIVGDKCTVFNVQIQDMSENKIGQQCKNCLGLSDFPLHKEVSIVPSHHSSTKLWTQDFLFPFIKIYFWLVVSSCFPQYEYWRQSSSPICKTTDVLLDSKKHPVLLSHLWIYDFCYSSKALTANLATWAVLTN